MEFLFGTWISLQKFWYFERRMFGKYLEVFHPKIWANPLSSCKIIHQTISHTFDNFNASDACPPHIYLYCFQAKFTIFAIFQIRAFQTPQIVRPKLSNTSSNEFVLSYTLPMLPWQEQRAERWISELGRTSTVAGGQMRWRSWSGWKPWCRLHRKDIMRIVIRPT